MLFSYNDDRHLIVVVPSDLFEFDSRSGAVARENLLPDEVHTGFPNIFEIMGVNIPNEHVNGQLEVELGLRRQPVSADEITKLGQLVVMGTSRPVIYDDHK